MAGAKSLYSGGEGHSKFEARVLEMMAQLQEQMRNQDDRLDRIVVALYGDGKGFPGLISEVDRIKIKEAMRTRVEHALLFCIIGLGVSGLGSAFVWLIRKMV